MQNIVIVLYGAGGTDSLSLLYKRLKDKKDVSVRLFPISKTAKDCLKWDCCYELEDVAQHIYINKPDIVINECSSGHKEQNYITSLCKSLGIFNIKFLDTYGGYEDRFKIRPDLVWCPNKCISDEILSMGLQSKVVGNPAFDDLQPSKKDMTFSVKPRILFCSQPLEKYFSNTSEFEIFREFYTLFNANFKKFSIDIKLHPEDNKSRWVEFIKEFKNINIVNFTQKEVTSAVIKYDICCGQDSTLMFKAIYLGVYTIYNEYKDLGIENYINCKPMIEKYERFESNSINNMICSLQKVV